ncbi:MAG: hypothetical protein V4608_15175 [Bacteroidota bacterium]
MVDQTYSPNKTVTLKEENLNTKTSTTNPITAPYPANKTVSLVEEKDSVIKETPVLLKAELTEQSQPAVNEKKAESYPIHKTVNITDTKITAEPSLSAEKKETPQSITSNNPIQSDVSTIKVETAYPAHKTINISDEKVVTNQDLPKQEDKPNSNIQNNTNQEVISKKIESNYPKHKTVDLTVDTEKREEKIQAPIVQAVNKPVIAENISKVSYPSHKTVNLTSDSITNSTAEKTPETSLTANNRNTTVTEQPTLQNSSVSKQASLTDYPEHKTIVLSKEVEQPLKDNTADNSRETKASEVIAEKREALSIYPAAKTAIVNEEKQTFIKEEKPVLSPAAVKAEKTITQSAVITKAKKPVLWIAASALLLLTSAAATWYGYQKQQVLNEEITALKQNNLDLTESVQRLQKDLHMDDIITRAGKLDANNNIISQDDASTSEVVRTCFSIADNPNALNGKKTVFIRLLDANNNVLQTQKDNLFEYRGNKISYSVKEEINYKKAEMMLCVDFKLDAKLPKGNYKAEIYNEGVLDGTVPFELK